MQGRSGGIGDELEDEQLQLALAQSAREMQHDPTETPNTGGSAASSSPSGQAGVQAPTTAWDSNIEDKRGASNSSGKFRKNFR